MSHEEALHPYDLGRELGTQYFKGQIRSIPNKFPKGSPQYSEFKRGVDDSTSMTEDLEEEPNFIETTIMLGSKEQTVKVYFDIVNDEKEPTYVEDAETGEILFDNPEDMDAADYDKILDMLYGDDTLEPTESTEYDMKINDAVEAVHASDVDDAATITRIAHQYGVMPEHLTAALTDNTEFVSEDLDDIADGEIIMPDDIGDTDMEEMNSDVVTSLDTFVTDESGKSIPVTVEYMELDNDDDEIPDGEIVVDETTYEVEPAELNVIDKREELEEFDNDPIKIDDVGNPVPEMDIEIDKQPKSFTTRDGKTYVITAVIDNNTGDDMIDQVSEPELNRIESAIDDLETVEFDEPVNDVEPVAYDYMLGQPETPITVESLLNHIKTIFKERSMFGKEGLKNLVKESIDSLTKKKLVEMVDGQLLLKEYDQDDARMDYVDSRREAAYSLISDYLNFEASRRVGSKSHDEMMDEIYGMLEDRGNMIPEEEIENMIRDRFPSEDTVSNDAVKDLASIVAQTSTADQQNDPTGQKFQNKLKNEVTRQSKALQAAQANGQQQQNNGTGTAPSTPNTPGVKQTKPTTPTTPTTQTGEVIPSNQQNGMKTNQNNQQTPITDKKTLTATTDKLSKDAKLGKLGFQK